MIAAEYAGITFTAKEVPRAKMIDGCEGCFFEREHSSVCTAVNKIAIAAQLIDCDAVGLQGGNIIYVKTTKGDPRQLDCAGAVQTSEAS